jgi:polysaccharide transporter, PST family
MIRKFLLKIESFRKTDLFKTSFWNGIATTVRIFTGLISNKIIAVYLGPAGVAMLGQFQNFTSIANSVAGFGINSGVTKYLAEYNAEENKRIEILSTGLKITLGATLLSTVGIFIFAKYLSVHLLGSNEYVSLFYIFGVTLFLFTLNGFLISVLNGYKEFKKIIYVNLASSVVGLAITIILVMEYGVYGALLGTILSTTLIAFITMSLARRSAWFNWQQFVSKFSTDAFKKLSKYTLMAFTSMFAVTYIQLAIRTHIINSLSIEEAGYWQGITKISSIYLMLITTTLSLYYLPRLSEIKETSELRKEIIKGYKFLLPITLFIVSGIFIFKGFITNLLFAPNFKPMEKLFLFQLIGDVFKISSWLLGYILVAKANVKTYILVEIFSGCGFWLLTMYFLKHYGLIGSVLAYCVTYFILFIVFLIMFRKLLLRID